MFKLTLAAVAALGLAATANAATTISQSTTGPDAGLYAGESLITNFDTPANVTFSNASIRTGSVSGVSAAPFGDATPYLSVLGNGSATLDLGAKYKTVSFYWGSIDKYNTVEFYNGTNLIGSFTGGDVPAAPANGTQTGGSDNRRVQFNFGSDTATSVRFLSSQNSFELDTVGGVGAVPEPATWALMMTGFGLVGASLRRRTRTAVAA